MNGFLTTRRGMIRSMVGGSILLPGILSELLAQESDQAAADPSDPLAIKPPHFAAKAKRVIFLFSTGGVSHIDTFDPKHNGGDGSSKDGLMGSLWPSTPNPRCGTAVSDLFPNVRERMDDICLVRSMKSAHFDHSEAALGMHTGSATFARPSMGSWISYGLGTFNRNLPSFIVIAPHLPYGGTQVYANDFLPAYHQGTRVVPGETPIDNSRVRTKNADLQKLELGLLDAMNRQHLQKRQDDVTLAARIKSFEVAFKMQKEGPEAFDLANESDATLAMYGLERGQNTGFGWQCLVARRLAERGLRFVELVDTGANPNWDSHSNMKDHEPLAKSIDRPIAGLLDDLKVAEC